MALLPRKTPAVPACQPLPLERMPEHGDTGVQVFDDGAQGTAFLPILEIAGARRKRYRQMRHVISEIKKEGLAAFFLTLDQIDGLLRIEMRQIGIGGFIDLRRPVAIDLDRCVRLYVGITIIMTI